MARDIILYIHVYQRLNPVCVLLLLLGLFLSKKNVFLSKKNAQLFTLYRRRSSQPTTEYTYFTYVHIIPGIKVQEHMYYFSGPH